MARAKIVRPKNLVEKYGEDFKIWSYSNVSSIDNCTWEYYLGRIKGNKGKDNIYSACGTVAHDILERFYNKEIQYEDMINHFEADFLDIELGDLKFSADADKNRKMRNTYKNNLKHFFTTHVPVETKVLNEKEIWIDVDGNVFIGYIDAVHKEDDCYIVTDYKTSSIGEYQGKKKESKAKQLLVYALALQQMGVELEKIKARWNFLKYTNVHITYTLKSGQVKEKDKIAERTKWVAEVKGQLKKDIVAFYTDMEEWEHDILLNECIATNSLEQLDESIRKNYELSDAYVYIDINETEIKNLRMYLQEKISMIESKRSQDSETVWEREPLGENPDYYCNVLCGQRNICKYYKDCMERKKEILIEEDDILKELDIIL